MTSVLTTSGIQTGCDRDLVWSQMCSAGHSTLSLQETGGARLCGMPASVLLPKLPVKLLFIGSSELSL